MRSLYLVTTPSILIIIPLAFHPSPPYSLPALEAVVASGTATGAPPPAAPLPAAAATPAAAPPAAAAPPRKAELARPSGYSDAKWGAVHPPRPGGFSRAPLFSFDEEDDDDEANHKEGSCDDAAVMAAAAAAVPLLLQDSGLITPSSIHNNVVSAAGLFSRGGRR